MSDTQEQRAREWDANKLYVVDGRVMRLLHRLVEATDGAVDHIWKREIISIVAQQPMGREAVDFAAAETARMQRRLPR